jgi:hypothetical protein
MSKVLALCCGTHGPSHFITDERHKRVTENVFKVNIFLSGNGRFVKFRDGKMAVSHQLISWLEPLYVV